MKQIVTSVALKACVLFAICAAVCEIAAFSQTPRAHHRKIALAGGTCSTCEESGGTDCHRGAAPTAGGVCGVENNGKILTDCKHVKGWSDKKWIDGNIKTEQAPDPCKAGQKFKCTGVNGVFTWTIVMNDPANCGTKSLCEEAGAVTPNADCASKKPKPGS